MQQELGALQGGTMSSLCLLYSPVGGDANSKIAPMEAGSLSSSPTGTFSVAAAQA